MRRRYRRPTAAAPAPEGVSLRDPQPDTGQIPPPARPGGGRGGHMLPVVPDTVPQLVMRHVISRRADLGGLRRRVSRNGRYRDVRRLLIRPLGYPSRCQTQACSGPLCEPPSVKFRPPHDR